MADFVCHSCGNVFKSELQKVESAMSSELIDKDTDETRYKWVFFCENCWSKGPKKSVIQESKKIKIKSEIPSNVPDFIRELISEEVLDKPRFIGEIKTELEQRGHFIPTTTLSPRLLTMLENREIRRIKKDGKWAWVKR